VQRAKLIFNAAERNKNNFSNVLHITQENKIEHCTLETISEMQFRLNELSLIHIIICLIHLIT